jgi:acyl-coenzyme A thioesterase 13
VDWASGNALATMGSGSGASVDMHVTFLNKAKLGEVVEVRGIVDKLGRRMAFTRVEDFMCVWIIPLQPRTQT